MMTARWLTLARSRYATRIVVGALAAASVSVLVLSPWLRTAEVLLAALLLTVVRFADVTVPPGADTVYFGLSDGQRIGVQIAPQSSAALLALPLLVVTAAIAGLRPADTRRALTALAAALGGLVLANQARVLLAAVLADGLGPRQREALGATVFGSMCTALCLAGAVLLFVFVFTGNRRPAPVVAGEPG